MNHSQNGFEQLVYEFEHPSSEFSPIPFWFWNDTLTEAELSRQIHAFKEKGVDGFVVHARLGLDPEIPYMSEKWLYYVGYVVELAEKLNMKVIIYDDAMYPSGSCAGQVVNENPDFCAKGLRMSDSLELIENEKLVAETEYNGKTVYFILTPTRGVIRGAYYGQDDCDANAPKAADLLNPKSVETFIRLTHQRYYDALSEHFGKTIIAIFTDEPTLEGRRAIKGIVPWTDDFLNDFKAFGGKEADLPALFDENLENAKEIRNLYNDAIFERMNRCYYGQIADWCNSHGIALTGHPAESDDIHLLSHFGIPCQDIVWRFIAPGEENSISGRHSTMAKCASDSARHRGKRRNGNECFGVCGHKDDPYAFDREDMKWYIDWLFARGCNLIIPHAFYYSLRGNRYKERPPEVGMHSSFWGEYKEISDYVKRCCAINTDSINLTDIAVLCTERHLPDKPVKSLYENQIEFNYLERELLKDAVIENGLIKIADQGYKVVILEEKADKETANYLESFCKSGGTVLDYSTYENEEKYLSDIRNLSQTITDLDNHKDLRLTRVKKYGVDIIFLANEGEEVVTTTLREDVTQIWDSEKGVRKEYNGNALTVTLAPRESLHLILK